MTKLTRLLATTALTLGLAAPALAQQSTTTPPTGQQPPAASDQTKPDMSAPQTGAQAPSGAAGAAVAQDEPALEFPITAQEAGQQLASDLIGTPVMGADGAQIGEISDLILDEENRAIAAVVSVGGFLGIGSKKVGVPWQSLQVQSQEGRTIAMTDLAEQELADAEPFLTRKEVEQKAQAPMTSSSPAAPTAPRQ